MNQAQQQILKGVEKVAKCANPGTLVVFEPTSYPILTSVDKNSILFAAAEYGKGRVFCVPHESYLENFGRHPQIFEPLWSNIKLWLTGDEQFRDEDIHNLEEFNAVSDIPQHVKLVKWIGTVNKTELFINQLLKKFVSNGGSVLCGVCPWGWLNISHGKILDEMSLNKFLCLVGICFSPELCDFDNSNVIYVENNQADKSHLGDAISTLATDMNQVTDVEDVLVKAINCMPCNEASKHLEKLQKVLFSYISLKYKPTTQTPVTCPIGRALLSLASRVYLKFSQCSIRIKAPNLDEFPGSIVSIPQLKNPSSEMRTKIIEIKSKFDEFHCTGCYLVAGGCAQITVVEGNPAGWEIRVGSHTDDLTEMNEIKRWPQLSIAMKLRKTMSLTSAFGGLIYVESPKGNSSLRIKLESILEAPFYDLNRPETMSAWPLNRQASGLWAELCGKNISFVVPSSAIRNLHNPEEALQIWDSIIAANHDLRGTNVAATWRERVVVDIQPYGNSIHSGYPVVISYENAFANGSLILFNPKEIYQRGWNLIHELGHNMQRDAWTPRGTEEITVNIFTLHAFEVVFKEKSWTNRLLEEKMPRDKLLEFGFKFEEWRRNPYIGLYVYVQLVNSFGWNAFKIIFRDYETLSELEKTFENDSHKWNEWISRFSNIVGLNVAPLFYFWAIPFVEDEQQKLTAWLPNDEITQMFPQRVEHVKSKYENLLLGDESLYSICPTN